MKGVAEIFTDDEHDEHPFCQHCAAFREKSFPNDGPRSGCIVEDNVVI